MIIANRTQEVELFQKIVQGNSAQRVLLVEAKSSFGKTWLLSRFKHTLPSNVLCVQIDLKSAQRGIPYIFSCVRSRLGQERFPKLNAAQQRYLSSGVEVSDTTMIGKDNQLSVVLSNVDESTRNFRLTELRETFFQDLRTIPQKLVFLFDSYEKATSELANWLGGEFLADVVDTPRLIVVIAGQQIPQPTIEWMDLHDCCCLKPILELKAWLDYTQNEEKEEKLPPLHEVAVETVMVLCKGKPAEIKTALAYLRAEAKKQQ